MYLKSNNTNKFDENEYELKSYFSKSTNSPQKELTKIIKNARETIDVAVYYITEGEIVNQLCKASKRGVKIRVITNQNDSYQVSAMKHFSVSNIPIKVNRYDGLMHLKNMIIDNKIISTGSYNFTRSAENKNEEIIIISNNKTLAKEWSVKFEQMWNDDVNYTSFMPTNYYEKYG